MKRVLGLCAVLMLAACEKGTPVTAAPGAQLRNGDVVASDSGVRVMVDPGRYFGTAGDEGDLVELHLEIDNLSGRPIVFSHSDFQLVAPDGRRWTALDPDRIDLSTVGLRDDLLDKGVSELVFETGNEMDGYIYFQDIDADVRRVDLRIRLTDARTNQLR